MCDAEESKPDGVITVRSVEEFKDLYETLSAGKTPPAPDDRFTNQMDGQVEVILSALRRTLATLKASGEVPTTPAEIHAVTEALGADLMFRQNAQAIAWAAAILAHRYHVLLEQWADLYVHENGSDLEDVVGLQPEQERAVAEGPRTPQPEHRTGQYL